MLDVEPGLLQDNDWLANQLLAATKLETPSMAERLLHLIASSRSAHEASIVVNSRRTASQSLLFLAISQGFSHVVSLLLELGADPNQTDGEGQTALDLAADAGYFSICQQLIRSGADASASEVFKRIFSNDNEYAGEMTEAVQPAALMKEIDPATLPPLSRAAFEGHVDQVAKLLGGDVTRPGGYDTEDGAEIGYTAFLLASTRGHLDVMNLLLSRGANTNATTKYGWTSLMLAAKRGDVACLDFLLRARGVDVNHLSPDHWTALAEATSRGNTELMKMLLAAGADPELRSQHDWTPMMHAAYRGDVESADLLCSPALRSKIAFRPETRRCCSWRLQPGPRPSSAGSSSSAVLRSQNGPSDRSQTPSRAAEAAGARSNNVSRGFIPSDGRL